MERQRRGRGKKGRNIIVIPAASNSLKEVWYKFYQEK